MDTTEEGLGEHLQYYFDHDGPPDHLTVSSDGHTPGGSPSKLYQAFVTSVRDDKLPLADVLPLFTSNPARALQLRGKGQLQEQQDADLLILHQETLDIVHLFASGRQFIRDGQLVVKSKQEEQVEESAK
jgi:beta-aspartyl-dipeptidase (metallo-type)